MNIKTIFIAGAPKCGTSSLFNWFSTHPEICSSKNKEPFYFIDEKSPLKNQRALPNIPRFVLVYII